MKIPRILLILALLALLPASTTLAEMTGLPNPIHEATRQEAEEAAGEWFYLPPLPEGVDDADYSYIDAPAGDPDGMVIAQAMFYYHGTRCVLRGAFTDEIQDFSGMYHDWAFDREMRIGGVFHGRVMYVDGGPGVAQWYDTLQSSTYSVSMDEGATLEKMMVLANSMAEWQQEEPPEIPGEGLEGIVLPELAWAEKSDSQAVAEALGFPLEAPQGAENPRYYLFTRSGPLYLAAVRYELEGKQQVYWARRGEKPFEASEVTYPWDKWEVAALGPFEAILSYTPGGEGLITWFDRDTGINRTVAVVTDASWEVLCAAAMLFI
ncbi:MAG: hypothetical protein GX123_09105 [Clostridiales bacterium]|nr:hypothetical protein [Clostridiales bacterium]